MRYFLRFAVSLKAVSGLHRQHPSRRAFVAGATALTTAAPGIILPTPPSPAIEPIEKVITVPLLKAGERQPAGGVDCDSDVKRPHTCVSHSVLVAVVGYSGGVGTCLLAAMERIGLRPFALVRSSTMRLGDDSADIPVDFAELGKSLSKAAVKASQENGGAPIMPVIADVTASSVVQEQYTGWLSQGISVVAANKEIFAGPEKKYQELLAAVSPPVRLLHETTVGAGLPVLGTLANLKASSHTILRVEGILSGTLAFVLGAVSASAVGGKRSFSEAVTEAKELGYTEPDPRLDLSGLDVARKAVILARLSGLVGIELTRLDVESLVPRPLQKGSVEDFMHGLPAYDDDFARRVALVEQTPGRRLHYAAQIDVASKKVVVGPMAFDSTHPFNSAGPDNLVAITTNYYNARPLVIQGAGAGGDVTATGVLADILECGYA